MDDGVRGAWENMDQQRRRAVERLLTDESLTADLEDPAARLLLQWAAGRAERMVQAMGDAAEEALAQQLVRLRRAVRRLARLVGQAAPEAQLEQMQILLDVVEEMSQDEPAA